MRNVLARVPKGHSEMVAAAIRTVFAQPDAEHVTAQLDVIATMLGRQFFGRRDDAPRGPAGLHRLPSRTLEEDLVDQPPRAAQRSEVHGRFDRVLAALEAELPKAADHLGDAREQLLAFSSFPCKCWTQVWLNDPQERLNREVRRRTDVVGIFPDRAAVVRLVGAVLAEQNDAWIAPRRYLGLEVLAKARLRLVDGTTTEEVTTTAITA